MLCAHVSHPSRRAGASATLHAGGDVGRVTIRVERQGPVPETTAILKNVRVDPLVAQITGTLLDRLGAPCDEGAADDRA